MSINWNWTDKMGEVVDERGYQSNLYRGNCFMIAVNEWTDKDGVDRYSLAWFFADKKHCQNCLGLTKEYKENSVKDYKWKKFKLDTDYKETAQFLQILARANAELEIELYHKPF